MLLIYVGVFLSWKLWPSRSAFVLVGTIAVSVLVYGFVRAKLSNYFANRVDLFLHGYVIADLVLETFSFEAFRWFQPFAVVNKFHDNMNFIGCTLAFCALVGGYHWFATKKPQIADGAAYGQTGV